ncbi:MAG TPA: 16S rRNA (guanine(966)-N(2))-methyltransferase RsmD, partial [Halothiobacillus sp.]|nr:16S rRNA (guanine(966)-N(2))-methyltransferase RsmD [Halothiobacillus sp.]
GIEALSRGAARVDFVEKDRVALQLLRKNLVDLGYADQPVHACDARWLLDRAPWQQRGQIDIVFIDPPFAALGLDAEVLAQLAKAKWLSEEALIYLEYPTSRPAPTLPVGWVIRREGRAGESGYQLVARG